jgi:hypothetical protein
MPDVVNEEGVAFCSWACARAYAGASRMHILREDEYDPELHGAFCSYCKDRQLEAAE